MDLVVMQQTNKPFDPVVVCSLIRGMAIADENAKHGIKLVIEDYPFAADGLELWSTIRDWVAEYVGLFYTGGIVHSSFCQSAVEGSLIHVYMCQNAVSTWDTSGSWQT